MISRLKIIIVMALFFASYTAISYAGDTHMWIMSGHQDALIIGKIVSKENTRYKVNKIKELMGERVPDEIFLEVPEYRDAYISKGDFYLLPINKQSDGTYFAESPFKASNGEWKTLKLTNDTSNVIAYPLQKFVNEGKFVEADKVSKERKEKENKAKVVKLSNDLPKVNNWIIYGLYGMLFFFFIFIFLLNTMIKKKKNIALIILRYFSMVIFVCIIFLLFLNLKNPQYVNKLPIIEHLPKESIKSSTLIMPSGNNILTRFKLPEGYERVKVDTGSYGEYLRTLILKPNGSPVMYFDGRQKPNIVYEAVLNIDVGKQDLQQCADAVMRLYAEFNYKNGDYDKIHFNFTNGFRADYTKWREGYVIRATEKVATWDKMPYKMVTYKSFRDYLNMVFAYAGTLSLSQEMKKVHLDNMQIGDVFIKGNDPGHCILVVDMAVNKTTGKKMFMLAQSYMPAQDIQILKNDEKHEISPWYQLDFGEALKTPEWTFNKDQLYRFGD